MNKKSYTYKIGHKIKDFIYTPAVRYIIIGLVLGFLAFNLTAGKQDAIIITSIYFIVGLGFTLLLGYAGLASLGTAGFMSLGVYGFAFLNDKTVLNMSAASALLILVASGLVLGLVIGFVSLRIQGIFLAIVTLGLSEIVVEIMKNITRSIRSVSFFKMGSSSKLIGNLNFGLYDPTIKYTIIILMILTMILISNIMRSATGRAMLSLKNSQSAGQAMGMGLLKYRLLAFVISTVLASLGGVLFMSYFRYTEPTDWGLTKSLLILAAVVIGGAKSIIGVLLGTVTVFTVNTLFLQNIKFFRENSNFINIFNGLLIIVIIMFFPGGLYHLGLIIKYKTIEIYNKLKKTFSKLLNSRKEKRYGKDSEYRSFEAVI